MVILEKELRLDSLYFWLDSGRIKLDCVVKYPNYNKV